MSEYKTLRYAHLKYKSPLKVGQIVRKGDFIGIMGDTACKPGEIHLHMDCVSFSVPVRGDWYVSQIQSGKFKPDYDFLIQYINPSLLSEPFHISHFPHEYDYFKAVGQHHEGFDIITVKYPPTGEVKIFYSGDEPAECVSTNEMARGYGNNVHLARKVS